MKTFNNFQHSWTESGCQIMKNKNGAVAPIVTIYSSLGFQGFADILPQSVKAEI